MACRTNRKKLNTRHKLGIDGPFVPEKSEEKLQNLPQRALYAKSNNYTYYYVGGNIYMRKKNQNRLIYICSEAEFAKLKEDDFLDASRLSFKGSFIEQLKQISAHIRLTQSEVDRVQCLLSDLTRALHSIWPGVQVHLFGSIVTGLAIKTSDVDCYIQIPPGFTEQQPIAHARNVLRKNDSVFTDVFGIFNAKVPIVKFFHVPTGFNCDINFSNLNGIRNSKLIKFLLHLYPKALPLALILKYWSKVYNITGRHFMSNYALIMMVIFYLQVKSLLPSVEELQQGTEYQWVNCWNTSFNSSFRVGHDLTTFYDLLGGFFKYYHSFDYAQFVISPYLGRPVRKQQLKDLISLPNEFLLYRTNVIYERCSFIGSYTPICIQDPFDHSRNCTVAISLELLNKIRGHIAIVHRDFEETPSDLFLEKMFTHKLVYEPESMVLKDETDSKYRETIDKPRHEYNVKYNPSGKSVSSVHSLHSVTPLRSPLRQTNSEYVLNHGREWDVGETFNYFFSNQNVRNESSGEFYFKCFFLFCCLLIWLQLNKSS